MLMPMDQQLHIRVTLDIQSAVLRHARAAQLEMDGAKQILLAVNCLNYLISFELNTFGKIVASYYESLLHGS